MSRRSQTEEQRALSFLYTATKEQLAALIQTAATVQLVKYPEAVIGKPARRTRGSAKKESPGPGFEPRTAGTGSA